MMINDANDDDDDNDNNDYYYCCNSLLSLLQELQFDKKITKRIIMTAMNISIRSSYYIFCRRNKPWTNPELLTI